jgi:hypothetical protein
VVSLFINTYQRKSSAIDADINKYNMIEIPTAFVSLTQRRDNKGNHILSLPSFSPQHTHASFPHNVG